jgi:hypothetical protein
MLKNDLWRPKPEDKHKSKIKVKKIDDELCQGCPNNDKEEPACKGLCPPMTWINGNVASKEVLLTDINTREMEYRDYKDDLIEMIEHRQNRIDSAKGIIGIKYRAIAILLLAGITQKDISELFCMSYRQINRISSKVK